MIQPASSTEPVSVVRSAKPLTTAQSEPVGDAGVPLVLDPEDIADLKEYAKGDGHYMPDHSTFAAALKRAELRSMGCTGCRRCGGDKVRSGKGFIPKELAAEPVPDVRRKPKPLGARGLAAKAAKRKPKRKLFRTVYGKALRDYRKRLAAKYGWMVVATPRQRDALRARGNEAFTRKEVEGFFPELPELLLRLCPACKGEGTVPRRSKERKRNERITARPTGSSKKPDEGGGTELNEDGLNRRGKTDRRLAEVRKRLKSNGKADKYWIQAEDLEDAGAGVFETYFAPGNETLKSLWPFTRHGRMLLDGPNPNGLTVRARVTALLDAVHVSQDREKQGWIDLADREAKQLLDLYITTWNSIINELVARSAKDRNGVRLRVGKEVQIVDGGPHTRGLIIGQKREFWIIQGLGSGHSVGLGYTRTVAGWHLERVT